MRKVIELLKKIREIDQVYFQQEKMMQTIPQEVTKRKKTLDAYLKDFNEAHEAVVNNKKQADKLDMEMKSNDSHVKKFEEQLNQVKNNKEYQAILKEIQNLKKKNDLLETQVVELLENESSLNEQIQGKEKEKKHAEEAFAEFEAEKQQQLDKLKAELDDLKQKRQALLKELPIVVQRKYELLSQPKDGKAIVLVVDGCCTSCFTSLTPQMELEVQRQDDIIYCETCGRILIPAD